tara:strand:- start:103 stop:348 length:246 start_codon:yes stop_codon:yes gene_type:complete
VLADIEELADGRIGVGRNLDQVQADFRSAFDRIARVEDTNVFPGLVDNADLGGLNKIVVARAALGRRLEGTTGGTCYGMLS